jgi:hypothetical protein
MELDIALFWFHQASSDSISLAVENQCSTDGNPRRYRDPLQLKHCVPLDLNGMPNSDP